MLINNRSLHVETHGPPDGATVILLHHGLGSTQAWRGQIPALSAAGYRVIAYDRWGYGQSAPRPALDAPGFEDDLADLDEIFITNSIQRAALIGHSDGGTIALYFASRFPERVASLVTVAAHIYLEPKMGPGILGIRQAFENDPRFRVGMRRIHGDKFETVFQHWFDGWHTPAALTWDMRPLLGRIACPALIIQGQADEHATPRHAEDIAANIPGSELWFVPGAKHMLPQDSADEFNRRVLTFFKTHNF